MSLWKAGKEPEFPNPGHWEAPPTPHHHASPFFQGRVLETVRTLSIHQGQVSTRCPRDTRLPEQRKEIKMEPEKAIEGKEGTKTFL